MDFSTPLITGRLTRRYKRFLADIVLDTGEDVTAHCPNPGAMMGLDSKGFAVAVSRSDNPKRKLAYTLELVDPGSGWVGINTQHPNRLAQEAILGEGIAELCGYETLRREVRYGQNSRIDLLLESERRPACYVEVKNVHLHRAGTLAEFPDCETKRGAKHLIELGNMVEAGYRAVQLFIVQRDDCDRFRLAADLDPGYARAFDIALERGVEPLVYGCSVGLTGIRVDRALVLEV